MANADFAKIAPKVMTVQNLIAFTEILMEVAYSSVSATLRLNLYV